MITCFWCNAEIEWSEKVQRWGIWREYQRRFFDDRCDSRGRKYHEPAVPNDD